MNAMVQFTDAYHSSIVDSPVFVKGNILVVCDQGVMKEIEISGQKDIVSQTRGMWYVGIKNKSGVWLTLPHTIPNQNITF